MKVVYIAYNHSILFPYWHTLNICTYIQGRPRTFILYKMYFTHAFYYFFRQVLKVFLTFIYFFRAVIKIFRQWVVSCGGKKMMIIKWKYLLCKRLNKLMHVPPLLKFSTFMRLLYFFLAPLYKANELSCLPYQQRNWIGITSCVVLCSFLCSKYEDCCVFKHANTNFELTEAIFNKRL